MTFKPTEETGSPTLDRSGRESNGAILLPGRRWLVPFRAFSNLRRQIKFSSGMAAAIWGAGLLSSHAQSTAFSYQGTLSANGQPASGVYDLTFSLFTASQSGAPIGPIETNLGTTVSGGLFSASLNFGPVFNGSNYWLEIAVKTNGTATYTTLTPRQMVGPVPYAIFSAQASNALTAGTAGSAGSVAAAGITGTIGLSALPPVLLTNGQGGAVLSGTFTGNAAGLTNLSVTNLTGVANTNQNTFVGLLSGIMLTNGQSNGFGVGNSLFGWAAGLNLVSGNLNTLIGTQVDPSLTTGTHNTGLGHSALYDNVSGSYNTALGAGTLELYNGNENTAVGYLSMYQATAGPWNNAFGDETLYALTNGLGNTVSGHRALVQLFNGSSNLALGWAAGYNLQVGNNNIYFNNYGGSNENGMIYLGTPGIQTSFAFAGVGHGNGAGFTNLQGTNLVLNGTTDDEVTTDLLSGSTNWQPLVNQGYMMYLSNNLCISNLQGLRPNALNWIQISLRVTNPSQTVTLSWAPYPAGPCPILPSGVPNGLVLTNSQGYYQIYGQIYGTNWATNAVWSVANPGL